MRASTWAAAFSFVVAISFAGGCASQQNNPQKADALFKSGQVAQADNHLDAAAKDYEKALEECPTHAPSLHALATIRTQQKKYDVAIALLKRHLTAAGATADAYNDLAYCQDLAGWPTEAEIAYRKAINLDPHHVSAHVNYGLMLARHGRCPEGLCQLQCVLRPAEAHYNLGLALEQIGKTTDAQYEFRKAIQLDPKLEEARAHLQATDGRATIE